MISVIKSIRCRRSTSLWSKLYLNHSSQRTTHQLRFLSSDQKDSTDEYLSSLGIENKDVQAGMKSALRGVFGNEITVDNLKGLGPQGLEALSKSVEEQLELEDPNAFVGTVHVEIPHHNFSFDLSMKEGQNFMTCATTGEAGDLLGEYLECACGGNMSCSTCHIILDEETFSKLDPPCEAEIDMLDLAFEPTETSRLGCQITMRRDIDGMTVTIPAGVNNMWG